MARYILSGTTSLAAATAKTVVRWNSPASRKGGLVAFKIVDSKAGASDEGIRWRLMEGGTDGTGTAATPFPLNDTKASVGTAKIEYTVEPTGTTERLRGKLSAGGGDNPRFEGDEIIEFAHASGLGIELLSTEARAANIVSWEATFAE